MKWHVDKQQLFSIRITFARFFMQKPPCVTCELQKDVYCLQGNPERRKLKCSATGFPEPSYHWQLRRHECAPEMDGECEMMIPPDLLAGKDYPVECVVFNGPKQRQRVTKELFLHIQGNHTTPTIRLSANRMYPCFVMQLLPVW